MRQLRGPPQGFGSNWLLWSSLSLLAAGACQQAEDDDPLTVDMNPGNSSAGSLSASVEPGAGGSNEGESKDGLGGTRSEDGSSGHAGQAEGGGAGSGNEPAAGGACGAAPDAGDCATCMQQNCCAEWQACELDDDCRACTACLDSEMDLGGCVVMNLCDIAPQATSDILLCGLEPCVSECGFD